MFMRQIAQIYIHFMSNQKPFSKPYWTNVSNNFLLKQHVFVNKCSTLITKFNSTPPKDWGWKCLTQIK